MTKIITTAIGLLSSVLNSLMSIVAITVTPIIFASIILCHRQASAQVIGEYSLFDYPESAVFSLCYTDDSLYLLVRSIHDLADSNTYDYRSTILKCRYSENDVPTFEEVLSQNTAARKDFWISLERVSDHWLIIGESSSQDSNAIYCKLLNDHFDNLTTEYFESPGPLLHFTSTTILPNRIVGIASYSAPSNQLILIDFNTEELNVNFAQLSLPIFFVSSVCYDTSTNKYLFFRYSGISTLDSMFNLLMSYPGYVIHTSQHGTVLERNSRYYSFGASTFELGGGPEARNLVFIQYDTSFNVTFSNTFGVEGHDDYPFILKSLASGTDGYFVGGHYGGPFDFDQRNNINYFIAKFSEGLDLEWIRDFGGDSSYLLYGIQALPEGRCTAYGLRTSGPNKIRYPFLLLLDEYGNTSSVNSIPTENRPDLIELINTVLSDPLTVNVKENLESLALYSVTGELLEMQRNVTIGTHYYDFSYLPPSIYLVVARGIHRGQTVKWIKAR